MKSIPSRRRILRERDRQPSSGEHKTMQGETLRPHRPGSRQSPRHSERGLLERHVVIHGVARREVWHGLHRVSADSNDNKPGTHSSI
jgi:hypothetical protein